MWSAWPSLSLLLAREAVEGEQLSLLPHSIDSTFLDEFFFEVIQSSALLYLGLFRDSNLPSSGLLVYTTASVSMRCRMFWCGMLLVLAVRSPQSYTKQELKGPACSDGWEENKISVSLKPERSISLWKYTPEASQAVEQCTWLFKALQRLAIYRFCPGTLIPWLSVITTKVTL